MAFSMQDLMDSCCTDFNIPEGKRDKFKEELEFLVREMPDSFIDVSGIKGAMKEYMQAVTDIYNFDSDEALDIALNYASEFVYAIKSIADDSARSTVMSMYKGRNWN